MNRAVAIAIVGTVLTGSASTAAAQTLRGSTQSMQRQHQIARQHDYSFLQTRSQVRRFVDLGLIERVSGNANYELAAVSHPYARPALKLFIERLAAQYRSACGEKLVVTSLTRPVREQPRNASTLSVHPAGMAVDLRVSRSSRCRSWLESTLLSLERQGVLDATRETRPPHYHVALYPTSYTQYVAAITSRSSTRVASASASTTRANGAAAARSADAEDGAVLVSANPGSAESPSGPSDAAAELVDYRVNRGDSLWSIARRHNTTVDTLKELNGLRGSAIRAGDVIMIPASAAGSDGTSPDS